MSGSGDDARAERLAAALRENLKRRKQQARGRQAEDRVAPAGGAADRSPAAGPGEPPRDGGD
ncbi:hypothetical protein MWN33_04725 [Starkeya koreensis]|uniref:Uncharacterized protein n=1 Tax=Ancylobacter koreensis TaxID=266121 RepID=A0ABT0DJI1_9HYPH|nr:hypothetical protein [Ancylobacter koreensis]MCK0207334.1 hypothetical protein [Ancylobacter koreensis]